MDADRSELNITYKQKINMKPLLSLKDELIKQQSWLFQELKCKVVEESYSPKEFGDSVVTLESQSLRIRFVRDRGQIFITVASPIDPNTWWNLEDICEFILHKKARPEFDLQSVSSLLRNNCAALINSLGLNLEETRPELTKQVEQKEREALRRLREQ